LRYYVNNRYYASGSVIYENGAVIISQGSGAYMLYKPKFVIENLTSEGSEEYNYSIEFSLITIYGDTVTKSSAEKNVMGVITKIVSSRDNTYTLQRVTSSGDANYVNLTIVTRYTDAWLGFLEEIALENKLPEGEYSIHVVEGASISFRLNHTVRLAFKQSIISTTME
ncbi:MAG: hypothetical protein QXT63_02420, partial [Thermoplasmata archaeon]